ncbi:MAG: hemerythrin domain-containing protein [Betaproteobacteria bacterium]|nr:hemerythrin domain-containing protein [Betaproteobacteria bacterium]
MRETAIAVIKEEHQTLSTVVEALRRLVRGVHEGWAEADFRLFSAMLCYIDTFPERYHHPKEDEYLFRLLRARAAGASALIDELQAEHAQSARMMATLATCLVHYQGGSAGGLAEFSAAVNSYAELLSAHMRKEELQLIPLAEEHLTPADWQTIGAAFQANDDPVFGDSATHEFRRMRQRILNLVPRKMRMRHGGADAQ